MVWGGGVCKVIIVSNPTAVEVVLSCIEVVVGALTICRKISPDSAKWLFIWVYGDPKYEESVKISQAPKSLLPSVMDFFLMLDELTDTDTKTHRHTERHRDRHTKKQLEKNLIICSLQIQKSVLPYLSVLKSVLC